MLNQKPEWKDAPDWAGSFGICMIPGDDSYGQWCWCSGTEPYGFEQIETRPIKLEA